MYACIVCGLAVLDFVVQTSPSLADGPSDVCPSPFRAEGPSFFCPPQTWLGRVAVCVICALGYAGWAAQVIHLCLCMRTQLFFVCFFGCGLAGTPPHVPLLGLGGIECSVVMPRVRTW